MSSIIKDGALIINNRVQADANINVATNNLAKETGGNLATLVTDIGLVAQTTDITTQTTDLLAQEQVYSQLLSADETLATNIITLDTKGHRLLDIYAAATTATTFTVDISMDNTNWVNHYTSSAAELKYTSTEWNGFVYIKLTAAVAGVSGTDTVTLMLGSK